MTGQRAAPHILVGVDGSRAARDAAIWAVDEAVGRDIPLRLACVVDPADPHWDNARTVLYDAQRMVESTGRPVKVETEIVRGTPRAALRALSRSAELVCLGSLGVKHACERGGSVAAAVAASAHCPVAVVSGRWRPGEAGDVVAEVSPDPDAVLRCAVEEARMRAMPLRAVTTCQAPAGGACPAHAHANRRIAHWIRHNPDVSMQAVTIRGTLARYLAEHTETAHLVVTDTAGALRPGRHGWPVLTVRGHRL